MMYKINPKKGGYSIELSPISVTEQVISLLSSTFGWHLTGFYTHIDIDQVSLQVQSVQDGEHYVLLKNAMDAVCAKVNQ